MFCEKCGKPVREGSRFCSYCGSSLYPEANQKQMPFEENAPKTNTNPSDRLQELERLYGVTIDRGEPTEGPSPLEKKQPEPVRTKVQMPEGLREPVSGNWISLSETLITLKCIAFAVIGFCVGLFLRRNSLGFALLSGGIGLVLGILSCFVPYLLAGVAHNLHIAVGNNLILIEEIEKLRQEIHELQKGKKEERD